MEDNTINVKVLFFANIKELLNRPYEMINFNKNVKIKEIYEVIINCIDFSNLSLNKHQLKQEFDRCLLAKNDEYCLNKADDIIKLEVGDILSVIPPISGG